MDPGQAQVRTVTVTDDVDCRGCGGAGTSFGRAASAASGLSEHKPEPEERQRPGPGSDRGRGLAAGPASPGASARGVFVDRRSGPLGSRSDSEGAAASAAGRPTVTEATEPPRPRRRPMDAVTSHGHAGYYDTGPT